MELYIHYTELPENLPMTEIVGQLNETLDDTGAVSGGLNKEKVAGSIWSWRTSGSILSTPRWR